MPPFRRLRGGASESSLPNSAVQELNQWLKSRKKFLDKETCRTYGPRELLPGAAKLCVSAQVERCDLERKND